MKVLRCCHCHILRCGAGALAGLRRAGVPRVAGRSVMVAASGGALVTTGHAQGDPALPALIFRSSAIWCPVALIAGVIGAVSAVLSPPFHCFIGSLLASSIFGVIGSRLLISSGSWALLSYDPTRVCHRVDHEPVGALWPQRHSDETITTGGLGGARLYRRRDIAWTKLAAALMPRARDRDVRLNPHIRNTESTA